MNYPLFVEGMSKVQIREAYAYNKINFNYAVYLLCRLGFDAFAAGEYLYEAM